MSKKRDQAPHSLSARVIFVCVLCLIIPLLFHTLYLFVHDYRAKREELLTGLDRGIKAQIRYAGEIIHEEREVLSLLAALPEIISNQSNSAALMRQWAERLDLVSLFYVEQIEGLGLARVVISSAPELEGSLLALSVDQRNFLLVDPASKKYLLYSVIPVRSGFLISGTDVGEILSRKGVMAHKQASFTTGIAEKNKPVFLTEGGPLEDSNWQNYPTVIAQNFTLSDLPCVKATEPRYQLKVAIGDGNIYLLFSVNHFALQKMSRAEAAERLISQLLFLLILGFSATFLLSRRLNKPLNQLVGVMNRVKQHEESARYDADPMGFEINLLGERFNQTMDALFAERSAKEKERDEKVVLAKELSIGADMQRQMIPEEAPVCQGLEIASGFVPAKEASGDFYDFYLDGDGKLCLAIADAAGKGIDACLFSIAIRSMLRSFILAGRSIANIFSLTNELACLDSGESSMFATAFLCRLDGNSGEMEFVSAAHPPALIFRKSGIIDDQMLSSGPPLGATNKDVSYQTGKNHLNSGDLLLLYTDGLYEESDDAGNFYGTAQMRKFIASRVHLPIKILATQLLEEIKRFSKGTAQNDDITFILVRKE